MPRRQCFDGPQQSAAAFPHALREVTGGLAVGYDGGRRATGAERGVIRLSIPARQALAKLTLPVLIAASFAPDAAGQGRCAAGGACRGWRWATRWRRSTSCWPSRWPGRATPSTGTTICGTLRADNARLRDENERLRQWQAIGAGAGCRKPALKARPALDPRPDGVLSLPRVWWPMRAASMPRAVLLVGRAEPRVRKRQIALDDRRPGRAGHRGRHAQRAGAADHRHEQPDPGDRWRAAGPRHPGRHQRAAAAPDVLARGRRRRARASAWSPAPEANAFPANLPVGTVHYSASRRPGGASRPPGSIGWRSCGIFDYGLHGMCRRKRRPGTPAGGRTRAGCAARRRAGAGRRGREAGRPDGQLRASGRGRRLAGGSTLPRGLASRRRAPRFCCCCWRRRSGCRRRRELQPAAGARLRVLLVAVPPRLDAARRWSSCSACCSICWATGRSGVRVLILLIVHGFALRWRRVLARQGFLLVWLAFVVVATGAAGLELGARLAARLPPAAARPGGFQAAIAAGCLSGAGDAADPRRIAASPHPEQA